MQQKRSFRQLLFRNRYTASVPVPYHSPVVGVVALLGGGYLVGQFFLAEATGNRWPLAVAVLISFSWGFLFAMSLDFYFRERRLIFREGQIDALYSIMQLAIIDAVFYTLMFFTRKHAIVPSILGALVWHILAVSTLTRLLHAGLIEPKRDDATEAVLHEPVQPSAERVGRWYRELHGERQLWARENPYYAPKMGYLLLALGAVFAISPRLLLSDISQPQWILLGSAFLSGFWIGSAPIFYNKKVALLLKASKLSWGGAQTCVSVITAIFYLALFGILYYGKGLGLVIVQLQWQLLALCSLSKRLSVASTLFGG